MSLKAKLARRIAATGPITIAEFMTACLHDSEHGYYATRPALGAEGDFITAPLISQMFGELIGLWLAHVWMGMDAPAPVRLVEMGPGDGALMSDILRAARLAPGFLEAMDLWLVETSAPLRALQAKTLSGFSPSFANTLEEVSGDAPLLIVSNELLDCLPARQFLRTQTGWAERMVGVDAEGGLAFGLAGALEALIPEPLRGARPGEIVEVSAAQENLGRRLGERIAQDGGAALFIDYGRSEPQTGDTLQALCKHHKVDVLQTAGEADLTVHADFPAFAAAARKAGAEVTAVVTQAAFLAALGIDERATALSRSRPDSADLIARQRMRLTAADQMGDLFKVVAIHSPMRTIVGFEPRPTEASQER